jgi:hypothetical protein
VARGMLRTLELSGVPPPRVSPDAAAQVASSGSDNGPPVPRGATLVTAEAPLTSASSAVRLRVKLPPGYHLTRGANSRFEAAAYGPGAAGKRSLISVQSVLLPWSTAACCRGLAHG